MTGNSFSTLKERCTIRYDLGAASSLIDCVVGDRIAVEIESGNPKRIRGAVLDLLWHPYPAKLLIIVDGQQNNAQETAQQCRAILGRELPSDLFRVIVINGVMSLEADALIVRQSLTDLGWSTSL